MDLAAWKARLDQIHRVIQEGRGHTARADFQKLVREKAVPREVLALAANLAYRLGSPEVGLRLLRPVIHPSSRKIVQATAREKGEYAVCLIRSGAPTEGEKLLKDLDPSRLPQVNLYRAFALMRRWEYAATIPLLRTYLKTPGLDRYSQLIAKANLAAALVYERKHPQADFLLRRLIHDTSVSKFRLLLGIALDVAGANFIYQGKFKEAKAFLRESNARLAESGTIDEFFSRKLTAMVNLRLNGDRKSLSALRAVRQEAVQLAHWETARDCDRFEAIVRKDRALFLRVYFGTPYESYRARFLVEFGGSQALPPSYPWNVSNQSGKGHLVDIFSPQLNEPLKTGQLLHRFARKLCSDFYRPHSLVTLFDHLFPDDFYDPATSPRRVHDLVARLREWFHLNRFPLDITSTDAGYCLSAPPSIWLVVPAAHAKAFHWKSELRRLHDHFHEVPFALGEAIEFLAVPKTSLLRILEEARQTGIVQKSGAHRQARYQFNGS